MRFLAAMLFVLIGALAWSALCAMFLPEPGATILAMCGSFLMGFFGFLPLVDYLERKFGD